ncbi:sensor histidine kinase [Anaerosporobacter faecicola]|uniref:sensor histidine kinase n=1 Tax=Anaerosporobacter faecicola TaxID=2718714 RepID=UPI00143C0AC8|nr:ATP-binding protein [Anaerosporobacter faecicola]
MSIVDHNNNVKFYNRISSRVYFYFAIIICIFAATLGIMFLQLSKSNQKNTYRERLLNKGRSIAEILNNYIIYENYDEYPAFLTTLKKIETSEMDIWIIDNGEDDSPMKDLSDTDLTNIELNRSIRIVLENALKGKETDKVYFSDIYNETVMSIGIPVYDENKVVAGAVILHAPIKGQGQLIKTSLRMILMSAITALFVCFIVAVIFAKRLTQPISKMRVTALGLAEGDYSLKIESDQKDELGDLARTFDILSDRLAQSEEERKNMEQMRMDFFANVSHELRTPITVIRAYTEMLIDGIVTDPEKINANYERMLKECKGMERLVGDLLLLSKMQNPDFAVEKEPINVIQIFDDILRNASAICVKKNIKLDIQKTEGSVMMLGDYDRLRQMFMIIFDNAVKFSNENSTIYIKIMCMDIIRISIKDEGVGITKEELPYIFDKFYKSKLRQNANGSGLGLAIARQIAIKHNGVINVESEIGKGTEFQFSFQKLTDYEDLEDIVEQEIATSMSDNIQ